MLSLQVALPSRVSGPTIPIELGILAPKAMIPPLVRKTILAPIAMVLSQMQTTILSPAGMMLPPFMVLLLS